MVALEDRATTSLTSAARSGNPTEIEQVQKVILVGGGFGAAPLYPIARAFKAAGSEVVCIMGARSNDLLIYENEMARSATGSSSRPTTAARASRAW